MQRQLGEGGVKTDGIPYDGGVVSRTEQAPNELLLGLVRSVLDDQLAQYQHRNLGYGECLGFATQIKQDGLDSDTYSVRRLQELLSSHDMGTVYATDLLKRDPNLCRLPFGTGQDNYRIPELAQPNSFQELAQAYLVMLDDLSNYQPIVLTEDEVKTIFHYYLLIQQRKHGSLWQNKVVGPYFRDFVKNLDRTEVPDQDIEYSLYDIPGQRDGVVESNLSTAEKRELVSKYFPLFTLARSSAIKEGKFKFRVQDVSELLSVLSGVRRIWLGINAFLEREQVTVSQDIKTLFDKVQTMIDAVEKKFLPETEEDVVVDYSVI